MTGGVIGSRRGQLRRLTKVSRALKLGLIVLGLLAALLEGVGLLLFIPLLQSLGAAEGRGGRVQRLLEDMLSGISPELLTASLVGLLCASVIAKNAVNYVVTRLTKKMEGLISHDLRTLLFSQVLTSCIDYRADVQGADIATTVSTTSWNVASAVTLGYRAVIAALTIAVFIALMIALSPILTMAAIIFLLLIGWLVRMSTRAAEAMGREAVEQNRLFGLRLWEGIASLQLIRAFGREDYERRRFAASSDRIRQQLLRMENLWALPGPALEISVTVLIGGLVLLAISLGLNIAALTAFLSLLYRLQGPIRELLQGRLAKQSLQGAIDDVDDLISRSARDFLVDGPLEAPAPRDSIAFRNVSFRYAPDAQAALDHISFDIPANSVTAIVGASGAGKSTVLALLMRYYDPDLGSVSVDGVAIPNYSVASWRRHIALMPQEVQLFNDTIAANIRYGRLNASEEDVRRAAVLAHAQDFITALPDGYSFKVGDRGMRLSGGQRQRIALARTLLRDPALLLLDEATNALDTEAESAFQLALDHFADKRTVVIVAHRLSTVRKADQLIVLSSGRIVEVGPPSELLRNAGHFARMYQLQQSDTTAGAGLYAV